MIFLYFENGMFFKVCLAKSIVQYFSTYIVLSSTPYKANNKRESTMETNIRPYKTKQTILLIFLESMISLLKE